MFIAIGTTILNTDHIISVESSETTNMVTVTMTAVRADYHPSGESVLHRFCGPEARALWEHLTSPAHCTDVLAPLPAPVRP